MKKLLCLLLALVMALSLAACSDSDSDSRSRRNKKDKDEDDEKIVAEKDEDEDEDDVVIDDEDNDEADKKEDDKKDEEKPADLSEEIVGTWAVKINFTEEMLGMEGVNIDGIPVTFTFNGDGEVTLGFADDAVAILEEQMLNLMMEMVYTEMEAQGMTREDIDAMFEQAYGSSVMDYMKAALEEMDITSMFAGIEETFDYELDGNKLNIDGTEMTIEVKGDKLTVTECEDEFWSEVGLELPVVMERVN